MNLLIIDVFDSFTYNLMHICEKYAKNVEVIRVNKINISSLDKFEKIIISPGPGLPSDYPILHQIIKRYFRQKDILGICLGANPLILASINKSYEILSIDELCISFST